MTSEETALEIVEFFEEQPGSHRRAVMEDMIVAALRERDAEHEIALRKARADALSEAAREVDLVAAEYIGMAGEAEFDPNWIAGESIQGAAARIRALLEEAGK